MSELSPSGELARILEARPEEIWLLRPDAHVAAVVTEHLALTDALLRAVGLPSAHTVEI